MQYGYRDIDRVCNVDIEVWSGHTVWISRYEVGTLWISRYDVGIQCGYRCLHRVYCVDIEAWIEYIHCGYRGLNCVYIVDIEIIVFKMLCKRELSDISKKHSSLKKHVTQLVHHQTCYSWNDLRRDTRVYHCHGNKALSSCQRLYTGRIMLESCPSTTELKTDFQCFRNSHIMKFL